MRGKHVHGQAILQQVVWWARWHRALGQLCANHVYGLRVLEAGFCRVFLHCDRRASGRIMPEAVILLRTCNYPHHEWHWASSGIGQAMKMLATDSRRWEVTPSAILAPKFSSIER